MAVHRDTLGSETHMAENDPASTEVEDKESSSVLGIEEKSATESMRVTPTPLITSASMIKPEDYHEVLSISSNSRNAHPIISSATTLIDLTTPEDRSVSTAFSKANASTYGSTAPEQSIRYFEISDDEEADGNIVKMECDVGVTSWPTRCANLAEADIKLERNAEIKTEDDKSILNSCNSMDTSGLKKYASEDGKFSPMKPSRKAAELPGLHELKRWTEAQNQ